MRFWETVREMREGLPGMGFAPAWRVRDWKGGGAVAAGNGARRRGTLESPTGAVENRSRDAQVFLKKILGSFD